MARFNPADDKSLEKQGFSRRGFRVQVFVLKTNMMQKT